MKNGAIGQFEVSWTFRGGLDLRDEVMGTEGTIWLNSFLRTGFEMFTTGKGGDYIAEKAESNTGWLFPVGDELNELGYNHMFMDMFNAMESGSAPKETFYDGYVVNSILDAAYRSAKSKLLIQIVPSLPITSSRRSSPPRKVQLTSNCPIAPFSYFTRPIA